MIQEVHIKYAAAVRVILRVISYAKLCLNKVFFFLTKNLYLYKIAKQLIVIEVVNLNIKLLSHDGGLALT